MNDEQIANAEVEMRRADEAKRVLSNPVYIDAFMRMKADLLSAFERSTSDQHDERTEIWRRITTLNKLEAQLNHTMQTGELAKKTLMQKVLKR